MICYICDHISPSSQSADLIPGSVQLVMRRLAGPAHAHPLYPVTGSTVAPLQTHRYLINRKRAAKYNFELLTHTPTFRWPVGLGRNTDRSVIINSSDGDDHVNNPAQTFKIFKTTPVQFKI